MAEKRCCCSEIILVISIIAIGMMWVSGCFIDGFGRGYVKLYSSIVQSVPYLITLLILTTILIFKLKQQAKVDAAQREFENQQKEADNKARRDKEWLESKAKK